MPALPLDEAGKYVAAAYLVFLGLLLIYVAIMGVRVARIERDLAEIDDLVGERRAAQPARDPAPRDPSRTSRSDAAESAGAAGGSRG